MKNNNYLILCLKNILIVVYYDYDIYYYHNNNKKNMANDHNSHVLQQKPKASHFIMAPVCGLHWPADDVLLPPGDHMSAA